MGRRTTSTTKGGKFMNPTDQARKEARRRELKKNKKQRIAVRQAVIKTKNPQQMIRELEELDDMELNPINEPTYNDKVVKDKRRKLLENLIRIVDFYFKEDANKGREYKGFLETYKFSRLKKEKYYESVKNAEEVEITAIPLPDSLPQEAPQLTDIPLPGMMPSGILKKVPPGPPIGLPPIPPVKKLPPGPPPGMPPRHKVFIRSGRPSGQSSSFHASTSSKRVDDRDAYDPEDGIDTFDKDAKQPHPDEDDDDDEFHHRDDDDVGADEELHARRRSVRFADDDDETFKPGDLAPPSNVTPLQAMMLKLAGQTIPVPPNKEDGEEDDNDFNQGDGNERSYNRKAPPGPPPGMPPGPPPGMPPSIMNQHRPNMMHPPHIQQNIHTQNNMIDPNKHGMMQNPNILSAPPSLIHRPAQKDMSAPHVATIVAKPQLTSNPKEESTRFMPTTLRIRREVTGKLAHKRDEPSVSNQSKQKIEKKKKTAKATADVAYDSFMKEMQGLL
ncbi:WW domain-binding protein 11 [Ciona intestinalis]